MPWPSKTKYFGLFKYSIYHNIGFFVTFHDNYFIEKSTLSFFIFGFENVDFSQYCLFWQKYSPEDFYRTFAWHSSFVGEDGCSCHLVNPFFFCFYYMSFPASFAVIASWIIHPNCVHTKPLSCVTVLIIWSLLLFSSKAGLEKREVGERLVGFCSEMELQWWRRWREGVESGNMATQKPPLSVHNMLWRNCITWIKFP